MNNIFGYFLKKIMIEYCLIIKNISEFETLNNYYYEL